MRFLSSIEFGITLIVVIILLAIVGILFPPGEDESADIYHSLWFAIPLVLLTLNITLCTLKRFRSGKKNPGFILVHLGFVVILAGGFIGSIRGVRGYMELKEGEGKGHFYVTDYDKRNLGFSVYLDDFILELYDGGPKMKEMGKMAFIKDFKSKLRVVKDGRTLASKTIEVNHPLEFGGYTFYQAGFDEKNLQYTLIQVVRDPAIAAVYAGFGILIFGLALSLFKGGR